MALKRKLVDDASAQPSLKQMKLVPFPSSEQSLDMDMDAPMSDSPSMDIDFPAGFHSRLPSSASSDTDYSSDASTSSPSDPSICPPPVNGRTFSGLGFSHLRSDCKQLPKLRVACGAGPSGNRSMWGLCEECGAIQMLDS
ncbi:uncharacterized protein FOMMEDRAFT_108277 [Fomitiporia mediterranea MF3/22]|uniref:uncharacterized protein n=1 Tax=Fomitiporia mediterranea (strain MF3/22) TaxID=694068 RepID=UPI0004407BF3|nr:uncharacterized protein FOMMEDRAFT_108277 [Fomitiporia mediterranea MF3/22]EJD03142.1 hypothetical protein FOMMEDRAFT_108277 [Fomitiporia mediterranea MF3/22]